MLLVTDPVQIEDSLDDAITKALIQVPAEAHDIFAIVHIAGLINLQDTTIEVNSKKYFVHFNPLSEKHPTGTVCLAYGVGNFESFTMPAATSSEVSPEDLDLL